MSNLKEVVPPVSVEAAGEAQINSRPGVKSSQDDELETWNLKLGTLV
jgi:hypothetical protein